MNNKNIEYRRLYYKHAQIHSPSVGYAVEYFVKNTGEYKEVVFYTLEEAEQYVETRFGITL